MCFLQDKSVLQYYKQNFSSEAIIFVIDEVITDLQYCEVSKEIVDELKLEETFNDVLYRLFPRQTDDIGVRISLLFEKQLIADIQSSPEINTAELKEQNDIDIEYHQLKYVSMR